MGHSNSHFATAALGAGLWLSSAGLAAAADPSNAADAWTGPYLGLSAGPEFDQGDWRATSVGPNNIYGVDPTSATKVSLDHAAGRLGAYAGWNFAVGPALIAGVEGDIAGIVSGKKSHNGLPGINYGGLAPADSVSVSPDFDSSIRARFGYALSPEILVYGAAGVAIRDVDFSASCPGNALNSWCGVSESATATKTLVGWTFGAGVEHKLMDRVSVRLDYRYEDFGDTRVTFFPTTNFGADSFAAKVSQSSHVLALGITYRF